MQIWGPCVASRDRWLHGANHHKVRVKTPVLSEGHRWPTRSLPSQPGEDADTVTLSLARGTGVSSGCHRSREEGSPIQQGRHNWKRDCDILPRDGGRPDSNPDSAQQCRVFLCLCFPLCVMGAVPLPLSPGRVAEETELGRAAAGRQATKGWLGLLLMNEGWTGS